jgi:hypothetical protein
MIFTISEMYCETINQDNTSDLSGIKIRTVDLLNKNVKMQLQRFAARGTAVKKMAIPLRKAKCVLRFNKIECVKRLQRYRKDSGLNPPSRTSICAFHNQFCEASCLFSSFGSVFTYKNTLRAHAILLYTTATEAVMTDK